MVPGSLLSIVCLMCQAQESIAKFASAYCVGAKESEAAINLLKKIPPCVTSKLTDLVRPTDLLCSCLVSMCFNCAPLESCAWTCQTAYDAALCHA